MPKKRRTKTRQPVTPPQRNPDILDVEKAAALLTVSTDTVYHLFKSGELPGRKVGRRWITTRGAVMRWIEGSCAADAAQRAIAGGDTAALVKALKSGKLRAKGGG
jgi:excisionase family DNA binding protein